MMNKAGFPLGKPAFSLWSHNRTKLDLYLDLRGGTLDGRYCSAATACIGE